MSKARILVALAVLFLLLGCRRQILIFERDFSINLARPGEDWQAESSFSPAQEEVLKKWGQPDFVRIWWDQEGELRSYLEVDQLMRREGYATCNQSWLYCLVKKEVLFLSPNEHEELPLSDQLQLIARYGDPEEVSKVPLAEGGYEEKWFYFSRGKMFRFQHGQLIRTQEFPTMGRKIKL